MAEERRAGTRRSSGWTIGRIAGTPVLLAPSWLITAAILTWVFLPTVRAVAPGLGFLGAVAAAAALPVLLALSVLLHEVAHGVTARMLGIPVTEYVVTLWGGHTQFEQEMRTPGTSALVSGVGPLGNAVLAAAFWWASGAATGLPERLLLAGAFTNGFVAVFNLLPGLPLDGGRVLEALVWRVSGDRSRGTVVAAWTGRVLAVGVVLWWLGRPLLEGRRADLFTAVIALLVGSFLWFGATQALRSAQQARRAAGVDLLALARPAVAVPGTATLADVAAALDSGVVVVMVDHEGRPVAMADPAAAATVPAGLRARTGVEAVAVPVAPESVVTERRGVPAIRAMSIAQRAGPVAVLMDPRTRPASVVGAVEVASVAAALTRPGRDALRREPPPGGAPGRGRPRP